MDIRYFPVKIVLSATMRVIVPCFLRTVLESIFLAGDGIRLSAASDCGLPVSYYIKEGPASVVDGKLKFTPIPPRAKFPLKVTVAAWQYGIVGEVQTAEPVEQGFYIRK